MKKLLVFVLLAPLCAFGGIITASGNASTSSNTNWVGGVAPNCNGDQIVTAGFTVTAQNGCIIGVKSGASGVGVNVSVAGGKFQCAAGAAITLRGFDASTNAFWTSVANSDFDVSACSSVTYDGPTGTYTTGVGSGRYTDATGVVSQGATQTWNNASGSRVYSGITWNVIDIPANIYTFKLETAATPDPGPLSNAAGTGIGSFGDSSLTFSSGGFCAGVHNEVATYAAITNNGDYWVDYDKADIFAKCSTSVNLTVTVTFQYGTVNPWGILLKANNANSAVSLNGTYSYCGSTGTTENTGGCIHVDNKYAPGMGHDDQAITFGNSVAFNHCWGSCISIYESSITGSNTLHHYSWTTPTFNNAHYVQSSFTGGAITTGFLSFFDLNQPVVNTFSYLFGGVRGPQTDWAILGLHGNGSKICNLTTLAMAPYFVEGLNFDLQGQTLYGCGNADAPELNVMDGSFVRGFGIAGKTNVWKNGTVYYAYRAGKVDMYTTVSPSLAFLKANHHAFVGPSRSGYVDGSTISIAYNITGQAQDASNFPGGCTFAYNQFQWIDSQTCEHNTFDSGTRFINFNDFETTVVYSTRSKVRNNIGSNNIQGIYRPANGAVNNISNVGIDINDYNDDYNNTTNPTNIAQATFLRNGAEYNTGTRNVAGVSIFGPSGYSLPDATSRALVLTASGTAGTNLALNYAWSGGAAVNAVAFQGTLTAVSNTGAGSCVTDFGRTIVCPVLTDSGASFTTTGSGLKGYAVIIASGTGAGQYAMIYANTGTTLSVFTNNLAGWPNLAGFATAPDATSKYLIIKPTQTLFDSGAVNSIQIGFDVAHMVLTSQTDSGITMATHALAVNPNYVSASTGDYRPTNGALVGAASDGTFVGALAPLVGTGSMLLGVYP